MKIKIIYCRLVIIAILTIRCIKTLTEKKDTYLGTAKKTIQRITLNHQRSNRAGYYGTYQHWMHQSTTPRHHSCLWCRLVLKFDNSLRRTPRGLKTQKAWNRCPIPQENSTPTQRTEAETWTLTQGSRTGTQKQNSNPRKMEQEQKELNNQQRNWLKSNRPMNLQTR